MAAPDRAELPSVADAIAPLLAKVPREQHALLIALAERMAADRYRVWADEPACAAHRADLLACAEREIEIAGRVESLHPDAAAVQRKITDESSDLEEMNRSVFADQPLSAQLRIQARGERLGAATWRSFAKHAAPPAREVFEACAGLEEESALVLESILAKWSKC